MLTQQIWFQSESHETEGSSSQYISLHQRVPALAKNGAERQNSVWYQYASGIIHLQEGLGCLHA